METIRWSAEALKRLGEIYDYIAADSLEAAGRVVDGINEKVEILLNHPRIGWRHEKIKNREIRDCSMKIVKRLRTAKTVLWHSPLPYSGEG